MTTVAEMFEELSPEERREIYKVMTKYLVSDDFSKLEKKYLKKAESELLTIKKKLKERKKAELVYSELDKTQAYKEHLEELLPLLPEVLKKDVGNIIETLDTHIYIKVDALAMYDAPIYSELDLLKCKRVNHATIRDTLTAICNQYADVKEEEMELHPYETK